MQELTKKHHIRSAEARFAGRPDVILKLREMAKGLDLVDLSEEAQPMLEEQTNVPLDQVFPELAENRAGMAVRGYRSREGFTQKQLAELTGISQHHISNIENGKCPIGKERAKKLAAALNCDYRRFL